MASSRVVSARPLRSPTALDRIVAVALVFVCITVTSVGAQESTDAEAGAWLVGGSVGLPGYAGHTAPELFTMSFHGTHAGRGQIGPDLFVGTMPRALAEGVVVLGVRGGLALPVALSRNLLILPSAGVSLVAGFGGGGGGGEAGINAGIAAVVFGDGSTGFRAGVTWHRFRSFDEWPWLLEIGFVRRR